MHRIIMLAALAAAPCLTPATAQTAPQTEVVAYGDLDLAREHDRRELDRRIRIAVKTVCGTPSDADPAGRNDIRRCRAETAARLEAQRHTAIASAARPASVALASER